MRTVLAIIIVFVSWLPVKSQQLTPCQRAKMIVKTVEKFHFNPRILDDHYSSLVFSGFIDLMDPYRIYFTASDISRLQAFRFSLDDEIRDQDCRFIGTAQEIYGRRLMMIDSLVNALADVALDFEEADSIIIRTDSTFLPDQELMDHWKRIIKLRVLSSYFATDDSGTVKERPGREDLTKLQAQVVRRESCKIRSKIEDNGTLAEFTSDCFLKAVAEAFDPHTNYFTLSEEQEFYDALARETLSFGFEIARNDRGEVAISRIFPGSPAWNTNEVNEGDVILSAIAGGAEKDFSCISMTDALEFVHSKDIKTADFFIRKKNGEEIKLSLVKEIIDVEDNVIKSYILEGEAKAGYIYLPSFYAQFDESSWRFKGCAEDLVRELIKLKKENIQGLIFDLRNNGGGGLIEATRLVGAFIDYGAIAISQARDEEPMLLKDVDRGSVFDAPMVVLVNRFSASASELFASAMQDLNRAVIAGSPTFGKFTMQEVLPVDAYKYHSPSDYGGRNDAFLKVTTGAFNAVDGTSRQKQGVTPDVILPTVYDSIEVGEKYFPSAIEIPFVDKKSYAHPYPALAVGELAASSQARVSADTNFIRVKEIAALWSAARHGIVIPLQIDSFSRYEKVTGERTLLESGNTPYVVKSPPQNDKLSQMAAMNADINQKNIEQIGKDIYIAEAYHILIDIVKSNQ